MTTDTAARQFAPERTDLADVPGILVRALDRYLHARAEHPHAWQAPLWLDVNGRGPLTATGICQMTARCGRHADVVVYPHRIRHHFSHTWLDRGGSQADLMELNGWPPMLTRYGASARDRRTYDRIMEEGPRPGQPLQSATSDKGITQRKHPAGSIPQRNAPNDRF